MSEVLDVDGVNHQEPEAAVEEESADEYNVEDIRAKRKNPRTGIVEYLIKWENFSDSENTWEPVHHLQCPELIARFEERESNKRKRRRLTGESLKKKPKKSAEASTEAEPLILLEDEPTESSSSPRQINNNGTTTEEQQPRAEKPEPPSAKGFERGLAIERIVGSCTDDDDKIWFFVKWSGLKELELIEAIELEEKAPRDLCQWYRDRLYYTVKNNNPEMPQTMPAPLKTF